MKKIEKIDTNKLKDGMGRKEYVYYINGEKGDWSLAVIVHKLNEIIDVINKENQADK